MIKLSNKDYIWSYIGVIMSLCSNLLLTPVLFYFLDADTLGLWYVFQSLIAITTLFDFGFSVSFARNINFCWSGAANLQKEGVSECKGPEPNFRLMKTTIVVCRLVYLIISVFALVVMASVGTIYIRHIAAEVIGTQAMIAWCICTIAIFTNLYYGYFNSLLRGVGAIQQTNRATVFARLIQIVLTIILLLAGFGIIGVCVAYFSYGFTLRFIGKRYFFSYKNIGKQLAAIKEKSGKEEVLRIFKVIWHNSSKEGIINISNYLSGNACTIIGSLYLTLAQTGVYSLGVQLASAVSQISMVLFTANQPVLQYASVTDDKDKIKRIMSFAVVTFLGLNIIGTICLIYIGLPIFALIKPDQIPTDALMLTICVYQLMLRFRECYATYFSASNRIIYMKSFLITSVMCVIFSVALLQVGLGVWGLVIAQILSIGLHDVWVWPIKAHKEMQMGIVEMIRMGLQEIKDFLEKEK